MASSVRTYQPEASEIQGARLPRAHEDPRRPQRPQGTPRPRPQGSLRVIVEERRLPARGSEAFPRRYRLGKNKNYRYVYRRGKSVPSRNVTLVHVKGKDLKIGFSVSGKVGNAVTRNRVPPVDARGRAPAARADEVRQVRVRRAPFGQRGGARGAHARDPQLACARETAQGGRVNAFFAEAAAGWADPLLSEKHFAEAPRVLPVHSDVLAVRAGGRDEVRRPEGRLARLPADSALQSVSQGRIRSRALIRGAVADACRASLLRRPRRRSENAAACRPAQSRGRAGAFFLYG